MLRCLIRLRKSFKERERKKNDSTFHILVGPMNQSVNNSMV
jgi:hypothetical protein